MKLCVVRLNPVVTLNPHACKFEDISLASFTGFLRSFVVEYCPFPITSAYLNWAEELTYNNTRRIKIPNFIR
jgi:hypothetical protein